MGVRVECGRPYFTDWPNVVKIPRPPHCTSDACTAAGSVVPYRRTGRGGCTPRLAAFIKGTYQSLCLRENCVDSQESGFHLGTGFPGGLLSSNSRDVMRGASPVDDTIPLPAASLSRLITVAILVGGLSSVWPGRGSRHMVLSLPMH